VVLRNLTESNATYRLRRIANAGPAKRAVACKSLDSTNWYLQRGFTGNECRKGKDCRSSTMHFIIWVIHLSYLIVAAVLSNSTQSLGRGIVMGEM
jgi:hypothetical protein